VGKRLRHLEPFERSSAFSAISRGSQLSSKRKTDLVNSVHCFVLERSPIDIGTITVEERYPVGIVWHQLLRERQILARMSLSASLGVAPTHSILLNGTQAKTDSWRIALGGSCWTDSSRSSIAHLLYHIGYRNARTKYK
jgi:hypothetical protein